MNDQLLIDSRQQIVSRAVLCCTAVLLALIGVAVYQHPTSVLPRDLTSITITVGGSIAFGLVALCTLAFRTKGLQTALLIGTTAGALLGVVEMANISFEYSALGSRAAHAIAAPLSMAAMIICLGGAGSVAYERMSSLRLAVFSGLWCALVGTLVACIFGFGYSLMLMPHMIQIMHSEVLQSGMADEQAYVIRNNIESASIHFLLAPLLGVIFSCIGGFISSQLRTRKRSIAIALGLSGVVQLASCIALIRFGLTLARSDRAPLISTGMIGGALALTYFWPVLRSIIRTRRFGADDAHSLLGRGVA